MADVNATPQNKLLGGLAQYLMALRYIGDSANKNPNINRVLQFNQIVPATIGASAGGDQNGD